MDFLLGALMGLFTKWVSIKLIENRNENCKDHKIFNLKYSILFWALASSIGYFVISQFFNNKIEYFVIFSTLLALSVIDFKIKKIPNELLIALIIVKIIMLIVYKQSLTEALMGGLVATMVFLIPAKMGKVIGMGDIKLSMIIGFFTGVYGFLISMFIMGLIVFIYWIYLVITKKGNMLSQIPMGPYISIGFMISLFILNINL